MERLPGLLADEPVYWIDAISLLQRERMRTELGFSDVAAHVYEQLVEETIEVLRKVKGVKKVKQQHRETLAVTSRGLTVEQIAAVVDQFWFERLPVTPVDPVYGFEPAEVLASPWPTEPPPPVGELPEPDDDDLYVPD